MEEGVEGVPGKGRGRGGGREEEEELVEDGREEVEEERRFHLPQALAVFEEGEGGGQEGVEERVLRVEGGGEVSGEEENRLFVVNVLESLFNLRGEVVRRKVGRVGGGVEDGEGVGGVREEGLVGEERENSCSNEVFLRASLPFALSLAYHMVESEEEVVLGREEEWKTNFERVKQLWLLVVVLNSTHLFSPPLALLSLLLFPQHSMRREEERERRERGVLIRRKHFHFDGQVPCCARRLALGEVERVEVDVEDGL